MSTKKKVIELLNNSCGQYISGQNMADKLYVTRASIWKAIKALEAEGYNIEAVTNKGYRLVNEADLIDIDMIQSRLAKYGIVSIYKEITDSTNDEIRRMEKDNDGNLFLIAEQQTCGRGRRGREFFSPNGTGLYMSLLIRMEDICCNIASITGIAAVAAAKAIDSVVYDEKDVAKIKWVNDIYIEHKKVAGILSEAFSFMEDEMSNYIIIGCGINVYEPKEGFPKELKNKAGALLTSSRDMVRTGLAISFVSSFFEYMNKKNESIKIYREKSNLIGAYVKINSFKKEQQKKYAKVTGINNKYHLMVEYEDGTEDELSSGEVSVVKY